MALALLDVVLKHRTHFVDIDKNRLLEHSDGEEHDILTAERLTPSDEAT